MRHFVVGDCHFKASNLVEGQRLVKAILERVEQWQIESVVFLGDLLDNHASIHSQALNLVSSLFNSLCNMPYVTNVSVLIGNHDFINNSQFCTEEHPFNSFKPWPKMQIVDKPQWLNNSLFVPYVPVGMFLKALNQVDGWERADVIFAHQEFQGVLFPNQGDMYDSSYPPVISGHIHERCQLAKNILYVGSPVQHSFGEKSQKTVSIIDTSNSNSEIKISLDLPRKQIVECSVLDINEAVFEPNQHTKIMLAATPSEWTCFKKSQKYKELIASKVKIIPVSSQERTTQQLKVMASRQRRTYLEALQELIDKRTNWAQEAFKEILKENGVAA